MGDREGCELEKDHYMNSTKNRENSPNLPVNELAVREYYNRHACDYEDKFHRDDPVRQREQEDIADNIKEIFRERRVLEIACGSGFWTAELVKIADKILATDTSPEMLKEARQKGFPRSVIEFRQVDAYQLDAIPEKFDAGLAAFWFSHVPKVKIKQFLSGFHDRLTANSPVFMVDNVYIPGIGGELIAEKSDENSYKLRHLLDGTEHKILKNYYDAEALRHIFAPWTDKMDIHIGECFWHIKYITR
ncbi:SAM-dependent methyltransferase [candidate division LCP-89 bacterium B3_LCP]|uniref:SAM-dependent methyltransferase n=1 Tax=candidate division LCP-89 bacterium B3_LCP TaxID=2012998 RepID=A0A532UZA6_UNCL8|nr:MAG: SAM-dependent methyltransferase [candidate division LCP-89 bacterium B3_LCP]